MSKINIDDLTIGQLRELQAMACGPAAAPRSVSSPYPVGSNVFIRTVTMYYTGKLVAVGEHELVLQDAAWVASTGRFADALETGNLTEVEPFPDGNIIIGRGAICDCCVWDHDLPRVQK